MQIDYDPQVDAAHIRLSGGRTVRTVEESDVCIVDYGENDEPLVIELLSVFGFAGASLRGLASKGVITSQLADKLLSDLRCELVAA